MAEPVAVEAFREASWEPEFSDVAGGDVAFERPEPAPVQFHDPLPAAVPPWPNRRLSAALAELGPARPLAFDRPPAGDGTGELPPPARPEPAFPSRAAEFDVADAVAAAPPAEPVPTPLPVAMFAEAEAPLSELDIISAIAAANAETTFADTPASFPPIAPLSHGSTGMSELPVSLPLALIADEPAGGLLRTGAMPPPSNPEPVERPPAIIERAIAEQQRGIIRLEPLPKLMPWPGLMTGFALSVVCGAGLFAAFAH